MAYRGYSGGTTTTGSAYTTYSGTTGTSGGGWNRDYGNNLRGLDLPVYWAGWATTIRRLQHDGWTVMMDRDIRRDKDVFRFRHDILELVGESKDYQGYENKSPITRNHVSHPCRSNLC